MGPCETPSTRFTAQIPDVLVALPWCTLAGEETSESLGVIANNIANKPLR
jgi:hypothetical protein